MACSASVFKSAAARAVWIESTAIARKAASAMLRTFCFIYGSFIFLFCSILAFLEMDPRFCQKEKSSRSREDKIMVRASDEVIDSVGAGKRLQPRTVLDARNNDSTHE